MIVRVVHHPPVFEECPTSVRNGVRKPLLAVALLSVLVILLASCGGGQSGEQSGGATEEETAPSTTTEATMTEAIAPGSETTDVTRVDEEGATTLDQGTLSGALAQNPTGELTEEEVQGILYVREEEKLARDVYITLYERWGLPIFQNITRSEETHMAAVEPLIDRYGLQDPVAGNDVGVFVDQTLQEKHDELVQQGNESLAGALLAGAEIEELDLVDLEERIAQTDNEDIKLVYENLSKGSRNHLRAFVRQIEAQTGEAYQPQYLDQATYEEVVNAPVERGRL